MTMRNRGKRNILYPIFEECSRLSKDKFWELFYTDLTYGKCPKGIYISNNTIFSSNKKKELSYNFSEKTSQEIIDELHDLLLKHTNICSFKDQQKKKSDMERLKNEIDESLNVDKFKKIRKKNIKTKLFINFVLEMKKKYKLSLNAAKSLLSMIQVGLFMDKTISTDNVIYKDKKIVSINGLEYDKELRAFVNNNESKLKTSKELSGDLCLYLIWNKKMESIAMRKKKKGSPE